MTPGRRPGKRAQARIRRQRQAQVRRQPRAVRCQMVSFWVDHDTRGMEFACGVTYDGLYREDVAMVEADHGCLNRPGRRYADGLPANHAARMRPQTTPRQGTGDATHGGPVNGTHSVDEKADGVSSGPGPIEPASDAVALGPVAVPQGTGWARS